MRDLFASSHLTNDPDSEVAGRQLGAQIVEAFRPDKPKVLLVYNTINYDADVLLATLRETVGAGIPIVGCSTQGVVADGHVIEEGFGVGVMALGGNNLRAGTAVEKRFQERTAEKGRRLGESLIAQLGGQPNFVTVLYDPLCGADVEQLLAGLQQAITCPIVGGAAGQPFGVPVRTYQYSDDAIMSESALVLGIRGPFGVELGVSHGTVSTGVSMTVTKTDGPRILTIDGMPAIECWSKATGFSIDDALDQHHMSAWAVAVERRGMVDGGDGPKEQSSYVIRMPFGIDRETGSITMQTAIPEGTRIKIHQREKEMVLRGCSAMAKELAGKVAERKPWASLGFECGARTSPFLGLAGTAEENRALRAEVAPNAPWLGMMAWGEVAPCNGIAAFHNYTYPVVVLTEL
jgi:hypothetical protein